MPHLRCGIGQIDIDVSFVEHGLKIIERCTCEFECIGSEVFLEICDVEFFFVATIFSSDNIDICIDKLPLSCFATE